MKNPDTPRDHGGGIDAAAARYGGARRDWMDLSTGINPVPYPVGDVSAGAWTTLPDAGAMERLVAAARAFWTVPEGAEIVVAPGASALIARVPGLAAPGKVYIPGPTYNEHAAAFVASGFSVGDNPAARIHVHVHPNNPDGCFSFDTMTIKPALTVLDESFCDVCPERSLVHETGDDRLIVLKSFGKFWGLAGLRLGFAIGGARQMGRLRDMLGPWPVSGAALEIGARALSDQVWAMQTRERLARDAARLDRIMTNAGAVVVGGTTLFRLYDVADAHIWQDRLARGHIWSRVFPYSGTWLRLGLPGTDADWARLESVLA